MLNCGILVRNMSVGNFKSNAKHAKYETPDLQCQDRTSLDLRCTH